MVKTLWPRLEVFFKKVKLQGQKFDTHGTVLSQGMYMSNMKALSIVFHEL